MEREYDSYFEKMRGSTNKGDPLIKQPHFDNTV